MTSNSLLTCPSSPTPLPGPAPRRQETRGRRRRAGRYGAGVHIHHDGEASVSPGSSALAAAALHAPTLAEHRAGDDVRPCLLWRLPEGWRAISSGTLGGGIGPASWIVDAEVGSDYARLDPDRHLGEIAEQLLLDGAGVGLLTAAPVAEWTTAADAGLVVDGTIGVTRPTWAAAPDGVVDPHQPGTINLIARVPVALSDAALVNAVMTMTEAKAQALAEHGVPGTGTASDAVCVACPADGSREPFGGPRSVWGARLGRATHAAVLDGLASP
ncbi:MAG: adenosylcobinamide amidohydrolase [Actinomycetota bacterium]